ncbi:MAG TPA: RusA family crossover junction endodeoxyribonuclease [Candidatus Aminicenantes bacterium]|nr:RusA family crossover junction endodeoxyribonuclease [Candidatus Aminicenantes bacterium]
MKMIHLILPNSIRSKKNSRRLVPMPSQKKSNMMYHWKKIGWKPCYIQSRPSAAYDAWEKEARKAIMQQKPEGFKIFTESVAIKVLAYYKGARPDLSGVMESVGDCLEKFVYFDDRQIEKWDGDSRVIHDLANPRTEVWVNEFKV